MMELKTRLMMPRNLSILLRKTIWLREIYVFTPDGAVRSLPKDSGPIDFAYEIHTKSGKKQLVPRSMAVWFH